MYLIMIQKWYVGTADKGDISRLKPLSFEDYANPWQWIVDCAKKYGYEANIMPFRQGIHGSMRVHIFKITDNESKKLSIV